MAMPRHRFGSIIGVVMLLGVVIQAGAASAQPTTSAIFATLCAANSAGTAAVAVGQSVTFKLCGPYQKEFPADITVNGQSIGKRVADPTGYVTVVITLDSTTGGTVKDPPNAPVRVSVNCGANSVAATGWRYIPGFGFTTIETATFNVVCAGEITTPGRLAATGAGILKPVLVAMLLIAAGGALMLPRLCRRPSRNP